MVDVTWKVFELILTFTVIFFPLVYMILAIGKRMQPDTFMKQVMAIAFLSLLMSLAVYPFIAALAQHIIAVDYGLEVSLILFESDMWTYIIVLLFISLVYLIVFNKTKEE